MHTRYSDILSRIAADPLWWDENAVPRFDPFSPNLMANIYAEEAALVRVECQSCRTPFEVAFSHARQSTSIPEDWPEDTPLAISELISRRSLEFGDPPNTGCCEAGASMSSVPVRVLQYWFKPIIRGEGVIVSELSGSSIVDDLSALEFRRDPAFEIDITPDWAS